MPCAAAASEPGINRSVDAGLNRSGGRCGRPGDPPAGSAAAFSITNSVRDLTARGRVRTDHVYQGGVMGSVATIEVSRLRKRYGRLTAVDDVSFAVQEGEIFGILGPNGAGKSTTVECL